MRKCSLCGIAKGKRKYTNGQWKKAADLVCKECTAAPPPKAPLSDDGVIYGR